MAIWTREIDLKALNAGGANTAVSHLGIEFTEYGDDFICARIHVDERTCQPYGILHGGVSVVLAETLGSMAAACSISPVACKSSCMGRLPMPLPISCNGAERRTAPLSEISAPLSEPTCT